MKKLTTSLCLIFAVLFGSVGVSWSADFEKGLAAAQSGDFATALRELTPLAKQGNARAQSNTLVKLVAKYVFKYRDRVAKHMIASTQNNLGEMYEDGRSALQDDITAYMWYNIAASSGHKIASENRDRIAKRMTPTQRTKAEDLTRECVRKEYNGC